MILLLLVGLFLYASTLSAQAQPEVHPQLGQRFATPDGQLSLTLAAKFQHFDPSDSLTADPDIHSPKSANIHPQGRKFYINSLEGCKTVAYEMQSWRKLAVVPHHFAEADSALFSRPSGFFPFRHYSENLNTFDGKPVEGTFTHGGRFFWVPFYRRTYDLNAQEPSAMAVIDTETDSTVLVMETGPLPKMVCTSHDGRWLAVTHWGDNTVGLVDITSDRPQDWHYVQCFIVDEQLKLDFGLDEQVNRDDDSGWCLRGTVFTPDDRYLLVACMGRGGGIAVIDMKTRQYLGRLQGMRANVRHLVIRDGWLYLSINRTGYVQRIRLDRFLAAAQRMQNHLGAVSGWQECKVGNGARTIELSPDGRYVFAACHLDSRIDIVDTQSMKLVLSVAADSYPVGLDVSRDGTTLITTSQGRGTRGGNCVDVYRIEEK
jgi:hypothetical protein